MRSTIRFFHAAAQASIIPAGWRDNIEVYISGNKAIKTHVRFYGVQNPKAQFTTNPEYAQRCEKGYADVIGNTGHTRGHEEVYIVDPAKLNQESLSYGPRK